MVHRKHNYDRRIGPRYYEIFSRNYEIKIFFDVALFVFRKFIDCDLTHFYHFKMNFDVS